MKQRISDYLSLLRPKHWIKNLLVFSAPFFAGKILDTEIILRFIPVFSSFSFMASASYIINDIKDMPFDRNHPKKKNRAIASGKVSLGDAHILAGMLFVSSVIIGLNVSKIFALYLFGYLVLQLCYSFYLKDIVLLDIFAIASGFVIRVMAGGAAFNIEISKWLFLSIFLLSLLLAAGKRIGETRSINANPEAHRMGIKSYPAGFLDGILWISGAASLIAYGLYSIEQPKGLFYTIPIITFGLFRYILLSKTGLGDPTEAIYRDRQLATTISLWIIILAIIIYSK